MRYKIGDKLVNKSTGKDAHVTECGQNIYKMSDCVGGFFSEQTIEEFYLTEEKAMVYFSDMMKDMFSGQV